MVRGCSPGPCVHMVRGCSPGPCVHRGCSPSICFPSPPHPNGMCADNDNDHDGGGNDKNDDIEDEDDDLNEVDNDVFLFPIFPNQMFNMCQCDTQHYGNGNSLSRRPSINYTESKICFASFSALILFGAPVHCSQVPRH